MTYPLVSFSIPLILSYNNCWWFGKPVAMEGDACASGIKDAHGYHYSTLASRVQQLAAFDNYILSFPDSELKDRVLKASRIWAFQKALNTDNEIKNGVKDYICPSICKRVKNRLSRLLLKMKMRLSV